MSPSSSPHSSAASVLPPAPSLKHVPLPPDYQRAQQSMTMAAAIPYGHPGHELKSSTAMEADAPTPEPSVQPRRRHPILELWRRLGVGSLAFSIAIHVGVFLIAGVIIFTQTVTERNVDFLPGGGTNQGAQASKDLAHKVQQKKRSTIARTVPLRRVVVDGLSTVSLPDAPAALLDVPDISSMLGGGAMGSGGFGKGGAGGGFGNGIGAGGMSGVTFKPLMMFGMEIKDTRKMAVVMDVSRSMTKYLPLVAKELDKIARQSTLVLYFGCGLANPPKGDVEDKVMPATGDSFATFWQHWQGKASLRMTPEERKTLRYDPALPMPLAEIYKKMNGRANTHFIDFNGIQYAWTALLSREVVEADTIYWFADFQDKVDEKQMDLVRKKLKARKQKLYIHASMRGRSFEQVRDGLVIPLGGEVIEAKVE